VKKLLVLSLFIILNACAFETEIESPEENPFEDCDSIVYHNIGYSTEGAYISEEGDAYRVIMDFENQDDFFEKDLLSARDVGMLAYFSYRVYAQREYPNVELVKEKLQNIFVGVTNTDSEFTRLFVPNLYDIDSICSKSLRY
jgi:hypothetical protein